MSDRVYTAIEDLKGEVLTEHDVEFIKEMIRMKGESMYCKGQVDLLQSLNPEEKKVN